MKIIYKIGKNKKIVVDGIEYFIGERYKCEKSFDPTITINTLKSVDSRHKSCWAEPGGAYLLKNISAE